MEFKGIVPGRFLQLAYWGDGVPQNRSSAFDRSTPGTMQQVAIRLPAPAIVRGTLDRSKFANAASIILIHQDQGLQYDAIKLGKDQKTFEFGDLPAGRYTMTVQGKPVSYTNNGAEWWRAPALAHQTFRLEVGENKELSFLNRDALP
jgi:hypothetical protein